MTFTVWLPKPDDPWSPRQNFPYFTLSMSPSDLLSTVHDRQVFSKPNFVSGSKPALIDFYRIVFDKSWLSRNFQALTLFPTKERNHICVRITSIRMINKSKDESKEMRSCNPTFAYCIACCKLGSQTSMS